MCFIEQANINASNMSLPTGSDLGMACNYWSPNCAGHAVAHVCDDGSCRCNAPYFYADTDDQGSKVCQAGTNVLYNMHFTMSLLNVYIFSYTF